MWTSLWLHSCIEKCEKSSDQPDKTKKGRGSGQSKSFQNQKIHKHTKQNTKASLSLSRNSNNNNGRLLLLLRRHKRRKILLLPKWLLYRNVITTQQQFQREHPPTLTRIVTRHVGTYHSTSGLYLVRVWTCIGQNTDWARCCVLGMACRFAGIAPSSR